MPSLKADTWPAVLDDIKEQVGEQRFSLWFCNLRPIRTSGDTITLGVPNLFVQEWLENHFLDVLRQSLANHLGKAPQVKFLIDPKLFQESRARALEADADIVAAAASVRRRKKSSAGPSDAYDTPIRPNFTLENFIVGANNKLAYACAREILESTANNLHPLFIHSLSGLGKTHLLQAIWHEMRKRDDGRKVEYISAEAFTNQFIYAIRNHRLDAFRHRYRNADVLMIDDVHFLHNKNRPQEELLHTYDALDARNKQLVLASDVHPKMLTQIKQSLTSRFASGMVVRIGQPDFSTRVAILKAKLYQQRRRVPNDVLRYVSRGFDGSVRELSGALTAVLAYASLTGGKIDIALARTALSRLGQPAMKNASGMDAIEFVVARHYGMKPADWHGRRQTRTTRLPRQVCMYLARKCAPLSCREIAEHFGSKNHSIVVFAAKRIEEAMKKDANLKEFISAMMEEIKRG